MNNPAETLLLKSLEELWGSLDIEDPYTSADGKKIGSFENSSELPFIYSENNMKFIRLQHLGTAANTAREALRDESSDNVRLTVLMAFFNDITKSFISQRHMELPVIWLKDGLSNQMVDFFDLYRFLMTKNISSTDIEKNAVKLVCFHNVIQAFRHKIKKIDVRSLNQDMQRDIQDFFRDFNGVSYERKLLLIDALNILSQIMATIVFILESLFYFIRKTVGVWAVFIEKYNLHQYFDSRDNSQPYFDLYFKMSCVLALSIITIEMTNTPSNAKSTLLGLLFALIYPNKDIAFIDPQWICLFICYLLVLFFATMFHYIDGHAHLRMNNQSTGTAQTLTVDYLSDHLDIHVEGQNDAFDIRVNLASDIVASPINFRQLATDAVHATNAVRAREHQPNI